MQNERLSLLPCPFCGSTDIDAEGWSNSDGVTGPACNECSASAGSIKGIDNIAAWNRRALHKPSFEAGWEKAKLLLKPEDLAAASPQTAAVAVKGMEWCRDHVHKEWHGNAVAGTGHNYLIKDDGRWCSGPDRRWVLDQIGNIDAAKAAAQADYERRIRSAIITSPQEVSEEEAPLIMRLISVAEGVIGYADLSVPDAQVAWVKWRDIKSDALRSSTAALSLQVKENGK